MLRLLKFKKTLGCMHKCVTYTVVANYHSKTGVYGYTQQPELQSQTNPYSAEECSNRLKHANIVQLVDAYRTHGHKRASLDPLGLLQPRPAPELDFGQYGVTEGDTAVISTSGIIGGTGAQITVSELIHKLDQIYCGTLAAEFQHLLTQEERLWFSEQFETRNQIEISDESKANLAKLLLRCQAFDHFVATKFSNVKRYGGEGGESMMGCFEEIFRKSVQYDVKDIVMCMPHRGRLNFMTCLLNFPPVIMFRKMKGFTEIPDGARGSGDVLSHLYTSVDLTYEGKKVHVSLIPNPSHLEANNPIAAGKARSKLQILRKGDYLSDPGSRPGDGVLCLQVHGDASFTGQGVVPETLCFADAPHFRTGGSVHVVVNNQVGFTTEADMGRSSPYCSDVAKVNGYPILHVNGDFPEDVIRAASLAMSYRQKFRRDVVIDLLCYRRWGHNEMDEPMFTQPIMYSKINSRTSVPDLYAQSLVTKGVCDEGSLKQNVQEWNLELSRNLDDVSAHKIKPFHLQGAWSSLVQANDDITLWDTGVELDTLKYVGAKSATVPSTLNVHPTIQKSHLDRRMQKLIDGEGLDWATAEALAMGSLLYQGYNVRISGQDVGRGTFSHRHCMIVDQVTDEIFIPLNNISTSQTAFLEVANSVLSEEGVLGFEYGMSINDPNTLVIWEAQFGDFFNAAQPIIDTYVISGELKWLLQSGLVMLLPHGMDGAGPEHSSCRMERFLQQCDSKEDKVDGDDVNIQIVNPTTPAQYFHLLRRQVVRNFRKPLIVVAPKVILRLPAASSSLADMLPGTYFHPVLPDSGVSAPGVTRLVFCSGKHFYALVSEREKRGASNVAFIRLESLCPFPASELQEVLKLYTNAKEFVWSQEEHRNMGAWTFVAPRFQNLVGCHLKYAGREVLGTPATGIGDIHKQEVEDIMNQTFA